MLYILKNNQVFLTLFSKTPTSFKSEENGGKKSIFLSNSYFNMLNIFGDAFSVSTARHEVSFIY